jgi:alkylhydroperoxidase family enzyme
MAWIPIVPEDNAEGRLTELYGQTRDPAHGRVDHVIAVHSLHPEGLSTHQELYAEVMKSTKTFRKVEREMVAVVVSKLNECHY